MGSEPDFRTKGAFGRPFFSDYRIMGLTSPKRVSSLTRVCLTMLLGEGTMTFLSARAVAFAKPWLFSFILIIGLLAPGFASADGYRPFSRIVVFGDSLSDSGNLFAIGVANGIAAGDLGNNW